MLYWAGFILPALDCGAFPLNRGFSIFFPPLPFSTSLPPPFSYTQLASLCWAGAAVAPAAARRSAGLSCSGGWGCSALLPAPQCQWVPGAQNQLRVCVPASFPLLLLRFLSQLPVLRQESRGNCCCEGFGTGGRLCKSFPIYHFPLVYHGVMHRMPPAGLLPSPAAQVRLVAVSRLPELSQSAALGRELGFCSSLAAEDSSASAIAAWAD